MTVAIGYRKKMARNLAVSSGISVSSARKIIEKTLDMISEAISKDGRVELRNFGVFQCTVRPPRKCRNPKTGADVLAPEKYKIKFKPGKKMIAKIIENSKK